MSTIVYGPQLKELVLEELSDSEYVTTSDLMKVLPGEIYQTSRVRSESS